MWNVEKVNQVMNTTTTAGVPCTCEECRGIAASGPGFPYPAHIDHLAAEWGVSVRNAILSQGVQPHPQAEESPPSPSPEMQVWVLMQRAMVAFKEAGWSGEEIVATLERLLNDARAVAQMSKPAKKEAASGRAPTNRLRWLAEKNGAEVHA